MKKIDFKILIITVILCLIPIIFGISVYDQLPEEVAVHFDMNNNPNNFMTKQFAIFVIPAIMAIFQTILCIVIDLVNDKKENKKFYIITKFILPIIDIIVYSSIILYAINKPINIKLMACFIIGCVFLVFGNYSPKYEPNSREIKYYNRDVLRKENRILGYIMVILGILFIICAFLPGGQYATIILIITIILALILVVINIKLLIDNKKQRSMKKGGKI